jgi:tetratricopeptide (TPR) repeat protein
MANPCFQARPDLAEKVAERLASNSAVVLCGPGGMGKSQLAKHYVHNVIESEDFTVAWRVDARNLDQMGVAYLALARTLQLECDMLQVKDLIHLVHNHLASGQVPKWLLIFDDVRTESAFLDFVGCAIPGNSDGVGHVIVTSRSPNWKRIDTVLVGEFSEVQASKFGRRMLPSRNPVDIRHLCETLGNHPLALCQAIGYLAKTNRAIGVYINAYKTSHHLRGSEGSRVLDGYSRTMETTASLAIHEFMEATSRSSSSGLALAIINYFSFLPSSPFPTTLLEQFLRELNVVGEFGDAIQACEDYGLLQRLECSGVACHQMHELTSEVRRHQLDSELLQSSRIRLIEFFWRRVFDSTQLRTSSSSTHELTFQACEKLIDDWRCGRPLPDLVVLPQQRSHWFHVSMLCFGVGSFHSHTCRFESALRMFRQAEELFTLLLGKGHNNTLVTLNNISFILRDMGHYDDAITSFEQTHEAFVLLYGQEHPMTASILVDLSTVYQTIGQYSRAIDLIERALGCLRRLPEEGMGRHISRALLTYGNVHIVIGNATEALDMYNQAIALFRKENEHCLDVAACLENISECHLLLGNYEQVHAFSQASIDMTTKIATHKHQFNAVAFATIGEAELAQGKLVTAINYFQKSLELRRALFGAKHPQTAVATSFLAAAHALIGDHESAMSLYTSACESDSSIHTEAKFASYLLRQSQFSQSLEHALVARQHHKDSVHSFTTHTKTLAPMSIAATVDKLVELQAHPQGLLFVAPHILILVLILENLLALGNSQEIETWTDTLVLEAQGVSGASLHVVGCCLSFCGDSRASIFLDKFNTTFTSSTQAKVESSA